MTMLLQLKSTPAHYAALSGHVDALAVLVEHGANTDMCTIVRSTAALLSPSLQL
jgi:hypothetical protein